MIGKNAQKTALNAVLVDCMHICIYVYAYMYLYKDRSQCSARGMYICIYVYMCIGTYVYMYICTYTKTALNAVHVECMHICIFA